MHEGWNQNDSKICHHIVEPIYEGRIWWKRIFTIGSRWPLFRESRQWHPSPVLLPGKSHGRRSLLGFSPWGREESDTAERLHFHFSLSCIGVGTGNPLQCSCLENPKDGGASWAAIHGVAQSRTRLKWLSSSSSSIQYKDTEKGRVSLVIRYAYT